MALAIKPDYTDPWKGRGVALVELGRDAEVAVSCDKGLAINLDDASVWFIRGAERGILGRPTEALASFINNRLC
ncbi:MAG: hypothetical protein MUO95_09000 [Methanoregula sp.]|nr:hypothetical protein [Methanoregula sp.]